MSREGFHYTDFHHKGARYRIGAVDARPVMREIIRLRSELEAYIDICPEFKDSLVPLKPVSNPPAIARSMFAAAELTGVGPLAAVAGAIAEFSARGAGGCGGGAPDTTGAPSGSVPGAPAPGASAAPAGRNIIVDNGGDVFIMSDQVRVISLFAGPAGLAQQLAFRVTPERCPVAICSSSAVMGHSKSFGKADLVTVVAADGALADAAATALCNRVRNLEHIDPTLQAGIEIPGVQGVLIVLGDRVGMIGGLPELVRNCGCSATSHRDT